VTRRLAAVPDVARRAGLYVRVSALMGRAGEDFLSPTIQIDTMRAAAEREGDQVVEVWEDIDRTGRTMTRPGLAAAQTAAREGRISVLYVYDLSRWARNAAEGLAELAAIEKLGVPVVSATERVDRSTSSGRLTAGLLLLLAEHYSDLVSDRWKSVHQANAERGVHHGVPPFGYTRGGKREIVPDPVEGPVVAELFRRHAGGESIAALARWATQTLGRRIDTAMISRTLRRVTYLGLVPLNGHAYPGRHQPLVDEVTFAAVQRNLKRATPVPSRSKSARHALAGLVLCGACGGSMHKRNRDRGGRTENDPFYLCRAAYLDRTLCPGVGTPSTALIEQLVLDWLAERVERHKDGSAALALAETSRRTRALNDRRALADEIAATRKAIGALTVKLGKGVISDTAYTVAVESLEHTLQALLARELEVDEQDEAPSFAEAATLAAALLQMWPDMTDQERNSAIRTHVRSVTVNPLPTGKRTGRTIHVTPIVPDPG
jgi:site-specific DNA recombinase